jgi:hypothetical protein
MKSITFFIPHGESLLGHLWVKNKIFHHPLRPELKVRKVNNFSPLFISGPHCIFSHTVSAAHSKKKFVSFKKTLKRKNPIEGVILANGQLRESPLNVMDAVARNSSNAPLSADFSLNYQVTTVDRHIGSWSTYW